MRPLFTIHAGEFLVGDYIGRKLKSRYDAWVPVRDTGVDLLLTCRKSKRCTVKLQVKFSRSFAAKYDEPEFLARGWFVLKSAKIMQSAADVWIFVVLTLRHEPYYVLVPIKELKRRIPKPRPKIWHLYMTIYQGDKCFNTRDLRKADVLCCLNDGVRDKRRDYTRFFENWSILDGVC